MLLGILFYYDFFRLLLLLCLLLSLSKMWNLFRNGAYRGAGYFNCGVRWHSMFLGHVRMMYTHNVFVFVCLDRMLSISHRQWHKGWGVRICPSAFLSACFAVCLSVCLSLYQDVCLCPLQTEHCSCVCAGRGGGATIPMRAHKPTITISTPLVYTTINRMSPLLMHL